MQLKLMSQSSSSHSPEFSSLSVNLSDENSGASSSRSNVVKKSNLKRKMNEEMSAVMDLFKVQTQMLQDQITGETQMQMRRFEVTKRKREDNILFINLESISDLSIREYFRGEQKKFMLERVKQHQWDEDLSTKANQIHTRNMELIKLQYEDKILLKNLESISDLDIREYFRVEQKKVMLKRVQQQQLDEDSSTKELLDKTNRDQTSSVDSKTPSTCQPK